MKRILLLAGLVMISFPSSFAGITGKVAGEVKDAQTGEPVISANVVIEGTTFGAAANIDGYFVILNLPPGKYTVSASAIGYKKSTVTGVAVSIDLTTNVNFTLVPTVVETGEEIVITAERPVIKKDLTSSEARVDASTIETLPVNEVSEVLSLQAGITTDKGGGIHIRGGRTSEVAYWVDGVSISDVYDGSQAVQLDNNSVQELQVISGTFNAEYGQAMSGIVNIVTKDGEQRLHGSLSVYAGDYATSDGGSNGGRQVLYHAPSPTYTGDDLPSFLSDQLYYNLNKVRPFDNRNIEGSLSGSVPGTPFTFYLSGRFFKSEGWLYGNHVLYNDGTVDTTAVSVQVVGPNTALLTLHDNPISMNNRERISGQAKLSWQVGGNMKLSLTALASKIDFRDFSHDYKLIPDGDVNKYDRGYDIGALWTHTLDASSFYTLNFSYFKKLFKEYLYESPYDPRYIVDPVPPPKGVDEFNFRGTNNHRFYRTTETRNAKLDYTNQVSRLHLLKAGAEVRLHRLYLEDYNLTFEETSPGLYVPAIPPNPVTNANYDEYTVTPVEFSVYAQDKLEYENMIVNVGVRFDYFNSKGKVLNDEPFYVNSSSGNVLVEPVHDPNVYLPQTVGGKAMTQDERLSRWYKNAKPKYSISPRFGISYPITDRGVLHFSYGHFLQIPSFDKLYQKPGFKVPISTGTVSTTYGNTDLNAQKTVMYEIGLQQQLSDVLSLDVTGFYRDTRDWVTSSPVIYVGEQADGSAYSYTTYINQDYANTRGITVSLSKRPSGILSFNLSYTYQTAEGVNSNPDDALAATRGNNEPAQSLTPLDWDQTHTANVTLGVGKEDWGIFVLGRYGSGLPYTPSVSQAEVRGQDADKTVVKNSRRRPDNYTVDLRLFKNVTIDPLTFSIFLKVFNLFDRRNEIDIFTSTGRSTATPSQVGHGGIGGGGRVNSVANYLVRPDYYSEPREIQVGIEINY